MYELRLTLKKQQIIYKLGLVLQYKNGIPKNSKFVRHRINHQPSKFKTRNWVEINDESRRTYTSNDIKFKTTMLRFNLCDYADVYIFVRGTITITGAGNNDATKQGDERDRVKHLKIVHHLRNA